MNAESTLYTTICTYHVTQVTRLPTLSKSPHCRYSLCSLAGFALSTAAALTQAKLPIAHCPSIHYTHKCGIYRLQTSLHFAYFPEIHFYNILCTAVSHQHQESGCFTSVPIHWLKYIHSKARLFILLLFWMPSDNFIHSTITSDNHTNFLSNPEES